jgi:hypothetical protein
MPYQDYDEVRDHEHREPGSKSARGRQRLGIPVRVVCTEDQRRDRSAGQPDGSLPKIILMLTFFGNERIALLSIPEAELQKQAN